MTDSPGGSEVEVDYSQLLERLCELKKQCIYEGKTTLFIWPNKESIDPQIKTSINIRIVVVSTSALPVLCSDSNLDYSKVSIAVIGSGVENDLSDVICHSSRVIM